MRMVALGAETGGLRAQAKSLFMTGPPRELKRGHPAFGKEFTGE
jgi:hypothetical protein